MFNEVAVITFSGRLPQPTVEYAQAKKLTRAEVTHFAVEKYNYGTPKSSFAF